MNRIISIISGLLVGAVAVNAAVVVELGAMENAPVTTFAYVIEQGSARFNGGQLDGAVNVKENSLIGARGSFSVTWAATERSSDLDASTWRFGPSSALIDASRKGWGITVPGEPKGNGSLEEGEAFLLNFEVSNLTMEPGNQLVFSVMSDEGESYRVYRRTASDAGEPVGMISRDLSGASVQIPVNGLMKYAVTDPGYDKGGVIRITGFVVEVVSDGDLASPSEGDASVNETRDFVSRKKEPVQVQQPTRPVEDPKTLGLSLF